jgi:uncharacterized protein YndB with AHSA1/START domain
MPRQIGRATGAGNRALAGRRERAMGKADAAMVRKREHVDELLPFEGRWELRFERDLQHPRAEVWAAITEPDRSAAWFPFRIEADCATGAPARFLATDGDGAAIEGAMLACDPHELWEARWADDEIIRFELEPTRWGTLLTLSNVLGDVGKAARDAAGWHVTLDRLAAHLDGEPAPEPTREGWDELFRDYADAFGAQAATVGPARRG